MNKLLSYCGAGFFLLAVGCGGAETKTFVANEAIVPANEEDAAEDYNNDGVKDGDDNALPTLATQLATISQGAIDLEVLLNTAIVDGTLLLGADVTSKFGKDDDK